VFREDGSKIACRSGKIFILFTRVGMANAILSIAGSNHQSHDKLVIFPGEDSTLIWVFQHCHVHSHFQCGTVDQILIKGDGIRLIVNVF